MSFLSIAALIMQAIQLGIQTADFILSHKSNK